MGLAEQQVLLDRILVLDTLSRRNDGRRMPEGGLLSVHQEVADAEDLDTRGIPVPEL